MKIEDLRNLLEVIRAGERDDKGEMQTTQEFRELCTELVKLTEGPTKLYETVPAEAMKAIESLVELDGAQSMRVKKIVENAIHVTIGTLLQGNVLSCNAPIGERSAEILKKELVKALMNVVGEGAINIESEPQEEEESLTKPLRKKEVVH